jgi:hypothetical protein
LAVIMIVPMGLLFAIAGLWWMGMDNNILTQVGFIVLVALACKNAILIVEFAKSEEDTGLSAREAAVSAAKLRVRPILMTSIAFILGVVPLVIATGAGAEMRRALGTAVFSGMLGVTVCGLFLTPVFYVFLRQLTGGSRPNQVERPNLEAKGSGGGTEPSVVASPVAERPADEAGSEKSLVSDTDLAVPPSGGSDSADSRVGSRPSAEGEDGDSSGDRAAPSPNHPL